MRVVLQRVRRSRVTIGGETVGQIGTGVLLLVGFTPGDDEAMVRKMADKIAGLRIFPDAAGKMNRSLEEVGGRVLSVSQFTLYADMRRGRRPSFTEALEPKAASRLYEAFNAALRDAGLVVETGRFGEEMMVELVNDGPVTLILDSTEIVGRS
ncbi:MAG: D-tyrosyl-tRNA(Tyr) deacylase [Hydrogenibacillus sp.]|nr:D-tyrosyl-tRNA(Tyr) deacylase [Hydrogenibacillus sp.]